MAARAGTAAAAAATTAAVADLRVSAGARDAREPLPLADAGMAGRPGGAAAVGAPTGAREVGHDRAPGAGEPTDTAPSPPRDSPTAGESFAVGTPTPASTTSTDHAAMVAAPVSEPPGVANGAAAAAPTAPPAAATPSLPSDVAAVVAMGFPARLARLALRAVNPPATPAAAVTWLLNAPERGGGGGPAASVDGDGGPAGGAPPAELPALRAGLVQLVEAASVAQAPASSGGAAGRAAVADTDGGPPSAADVALDTLHALVTNALRSPAGAAGERHRRVRAGVAGPFWARAGRWAGAAAVLAAVGFREEGGWWVCGRPDAALLWMGKVEVEAAALARG